MVLGDLAVELIWVVGVPMAVVVDSRLIWAVLEAAAVEAMVQL